MSDVKLESVISELTRPFPPEDIKWRVQNFQVKSGKGLVVPYLDSRAIQERLDEVVPGNWEIYFRRETLDGPAYVGGHVVYATLKVCGVTREEVGSSFILNLKTTRGSEEDGYEKLNDNKLDPKTATSDSVKRVAAQFGIGRYLWLFDKAAWIDCADANGKNKYQYKPPSYADVPKTYHDYLHGLGITSQQTSDSSSINVVLYLLQQVKDEKISLDNMLIYLKSSGQEALSTIITRLRTEKAS